MTIKRDREFFRSGKRYTRTNNPGIWKCYLSRRPIKVGDTYYIRNEDVALASEVE